MVVAAWCADHSEPIRMTFHVIARLSAAARPTGSLRHSRNRTIAGLKPMRHLTMTTIIMRTSDDNRGQLFLALFQGFQFLGNLPITLVFHEALTGTQE